MRSQRLTQISLLTNAVMLGVVALMLLNRPGVPSFLPLAAAQNTPPIAGGAGIFLMPGQFSPNTWGCYIMDVDSQILAAYVYYPGEKDLRLVATRSFVWDRQLPKFNTSPDPDEIKDLVEAARNKTRLEKTP